MRTKWKWASLGLLVSAVSAGVGVLTMDSLVSDEGTVAADDAIDDEGAADTEEAPGAAGGAPTRESDRVLHAPDLEDWDLREIPDPIDPASHDGLVATSYHFAGEIYASPSERHDIAGFARRGVPVEVARRVGGRGCPGGTWYEIEPFGYVCTTLGFTIGPRIDARGHFYHEANLDSTRPFHYAKVETEGAPRLYHPPSAAERDAIDRVIASIASSDDADGVDDADDAEECPLPEVVANAMNGVYLLALTDEVVESAGEQWVHTVRDRWVRAADVVDKPVITFHGERIDGVEDLPLAFAYVEDRDLYEVDGEGYRRVGIAEKGARFHVAREREHDGVAWVESAAGLALRRDAVRVVRATDRPRDRIPTGAKWIHIDLDEQTLVAYEGDRPILATLVSSGKEGHDTPVGTFRIREKHATVTMNGDDPLDGFYEVEEVPWTMYYWNSYALHGAYWHDGFGQVRSHGCTNLPPADARFLYGWTTPSVPTGWHALRRSRGTYVHFTRE